MFASRRMACLALLAILSCMVRAQEMTQSRGDRSSPTAVPPLGPASATSLSVIAARADVAALRTMIRPNLLKGGFGEAHMDRHLMRFMRQGGDWLPLGARLGPRGMDGLWVRYDTAGNPRGLIVSESKYGTSRLGMTRDGIQMGLRWRSTRLAEMAAEYRSISQSIASGRMDIAGPGGSVGKQRLQMPLADGRKVAVFARSRPGEPWEFVGPRELMPAAGRQSGMLGAYLKLASEGKVAYESSIYRIELRRDAMVVVIKDASSLGTTSSESGLPVRRTIAIPLTASRLAQLRDMGRVEVARLLRQAHPTMSEADIRRYSTEIIRSNRDLNAMLSSSPRSLTSIIVRNSILSGVVGGGLDVVVQAGWQYYQTGGVNWRRVAISGGIAFAGSALGAGAGQVAVVLVTRNPVIYQYMARASATLGLGSTSLATNGLGGMIGGGVASLFIAYGGWLAGMYDARTANRMAMAGGASAFAASMFGVGVFSLVATFGTASTGVAISSLGGAAATSATLAWLGGGSLAAGGFGVLGGSIVMTGGVALVAIGVGSAVYAGFRYFDEKQDLERIRLTIEDLRAREGFSLRGIGAGRFEVHTIKPQQ